MTGTQSSPHVSTGRVARIYRLEHVSPVRLSSLAEVLAHTCGICSLDVDFEGASIVVEFDTALVTETWIEELLEGHRDASGSRASSKRLYRGPSYGA